MTESIPTMTFDEKFQEIGKITMALIYLEQLVASDNMFCSGVNSGWAINTPYDWIIACRDLVGALGTSFRQSHFDDYFSVNFQNKQDYVASMEFAKLKSISSMHLLKSKLAEMDLVQKMKDHAERKLQA